MRDTQVALTKADYEQLAQLRKSLRQVLREGKEAARAAGITPQQGQLLLAIKGVPGRDWATVSELADALQIRHHAAVGLVDRCEANGMVIRSSSPDDRRLVCVSLTPLAQAVLRQMNHSVRTELEVLRDSFQGADS